MDASIGDDCVGAVGIVPELTGLLLFVLQELRIKIEIIPSIKSLFIIFFPFV
jgi:hypothetical protein